MPLSFSDTAIDSLLTAGHLICIPQFIYFTPTIQKGFPTLHAYFFLVTKDCSLIPVTGIKVRLYTKT
jgi:hypothetical protein